MWNGLAAQDGQVVDVDRHGVGAGVELGERDREPATAVVARDAVLEGHLKKKQSKPIQTNPNQKKMA